MLNTGSNMRCVGCNACSKACPTGALSLQRDSEGFYRIAADDKKCVDCGRCRAVCSEVSVSLPAFHPQNHGYYAARHLDPAVVSASSSGGAFHALAAETLAFDNSAVYGVIFDEDGIVRYRRAATLAACASMRGSKYVQAHLTDELLSLFLEDVRKDCTILFIGTSCYIANLKRLLSLLQLPDTHILWVDFVCSGVLSPAIQQAELDSLPEQPTGISHRDKSSGWRNFSVAYSTASWNRKTIFTLSTVGKLLDTPEAKLNSCSSCSFSRYQRVADISLGDFWNEQYLPRKWMDDKGTSLVMIHSARGAAFFQRICEKELQAFPVTQQACKSVRLESPKADISPVRRQKFWQDFHAMKYEAFLRQYCRASISERILMQYIRPFLIRTGLLRIINRVRRPV